MRSTDALANERKKRPAWKAANAARVLGLVLTIISLLPIAAIIMSFGFRVGSGSVTGILRTIAAMMFYLAPGVALIALSYGVRRGSRGHTVAALVIAILLALFLSFAAVVQVIFFLSLMNNRGMAGSWAMFMVPALMGILDLISILLAVHCIQVLRFPDEEQARGFEPLMVAPPVGDEDPSDR